MANLDIPSRSVSAALFIQSLEHSCIDLRHLKAVTDYFNMPGPHQQQNIQIIPPFVTAIASINVALHPSAVDLA